MAKPKDKMFGCPACGFRVSSGEDACPRCGNAFTKETRFECPFCGELAERGAKSCQACHVNYSEFKEKTEARGGDDSIDSLLLEIIKLESTSVKQDDKRFSCPKCAWMLDGSEERCPKCGTSFLADVSFQCPICGELVSSNSPKCPGCGASFSEEDEDAVSKHEEMTSTLEEISTAAAMTLPPSAELEPSKAEESEQREGEEGSVVASKISSMFGKIAEAVKIDSKPQPSPKKEMPVEETSETSAPMAAAPAEDTAKRDEPEVATGEATPSDKPPPVKKTRKLKAKPK